MKNLKLIQIKVTQEDYDKFILLRQRFKYSTLSEFIRREILKKEESNGY